MPRNLVICTLFILSCSINTLRSTSGGRFVNNIYLVFDRFNDSLFTANHLHNLASSLFNMHSSSNWLSPAQSTFVSSAKSINFTKFDTLQISLI